MVFSYPNTVLQTPSGLLYTPSHDMEPKFVSSEKTPTPKIGR